jgi:SAM-dependent methyltransferase
MNPRAQSASSDDKVRQLVREGYASVARGERQSCGCGTTCGDGPGVAERVGYAAEDLQALPKGADMGLSCGNPTALAGLSPGEIVLDLGSGGGLDCFIAGSKVGPSGRVIGVDMTPEMISKARGNLAAYRERSGLANVEFRLGEIEHLPVADGSIDAVISNCVLNLSPDKPQVWRDIARVLRPGGRVAVSDLALLRPLPPEVRDMVEALIGCIAGAVLVEETRRMMAAAGLVDIQLAPKSGYVVAMNELQDPLYRQIVEKLPAGTRPADFITSLDITARRAP